MTIELPPVYSGHNSFWSWGPPPEGRTVVIHVGDWRPTDCRRFFVDCHEAAQVDNEYKIPNAERRKAISV
jgi:hypothetical protein